MSPVKADVFISSGTKEIKLIDISSLENVSYKLKCFSIQQYSHNTDDVLVNVCFQSQVCRHLHVSPTNRTIQRFVIEELL